MRLNLNDVILRSTHNKVVSLDNKVSTEAVHHVPADIPVRGPLGQPFDAPVS